jgi:hypothetical protein
MATQSRNGVMPPKNRTKDALAKSDSSARKETEAVLANAVGQIENAFGKGYIIKHHNVAGAAEARKTKRAL